MFPRIRILSIFFILLFASLAARLFYWQVMKGAELSEQARSQYSSSKITTAPRGNILASDGSFWVVRTGSWLISANPKKISGDAGKIAEKLAKILVDDPNNKDSVFNEAIRIQNLLSKPETSWVSIKSKVSEETKRNIEALKIQGLGFEAQETSFYPEASSAAQILGFVGKNDEGADIGYFGLEGYYDLPLKGKSGFSEGQKDALGSPLLLGKSMQVSAIPGVNLKTSVDKRIQILVEDELKKGIEKYGASGGNITVMDPANGKILGMASLPSFDPANYSKYTTALFKNPVISDTFEPGSIFKVLVMAAGLDAGAVKPDTKCDICGGPLKLDKYFIKTWNDKYTPDISMTDVIVESDNVGMSFIGQKLGADALYDYLAKFGIGAKTGIDLQGETAGRLKAKGTWNVVDQATATFGQGVSVTGIEMVRAVAVIANGGFLVTPKVVDSINGEGWNEKTNTDPPVRIISRQTSSEVTQMMVEAVERGGGQVVQDPRF